MILGHPQEPYHLEFTHHRGTKAGRAPTPDNLLIFYLPEQQTWQATGVEPVAAYNPY